MTSLRCSMGEPVHHDTGGELAVLAGGVGAARFLSGLVHVVPPETVTAIVNTGDDVVVHGLTVCPDIDIVLYTLAGTVDTDKGWGIAGDTSHCLSMLAKLGQETWFRIGDRDLAVHIHRTERLRQGATLASVTDEIRIALGVATRIVPMTNSPVRTTIDTGADLLPFQEYFVRRATRDPVRGVAFRGIEDAVPAPGAIDTILGAQGVLIAPSNPFVSIGAILSVPGIRESVIRTKAPVLGVSPIIAGAAVKGPAARMMESLGHEVSALGIARIYRDLVDVMVIDRQDHALRPAIEALGMRAVVTDTVMSSLEKKVCLAKTVLEALELVV